MNDSTFVKKKMNDSNKILFGLNIKKLRKGLKLSQKLFAKPLGVTGTHISKIEHGKTDISKLLLNAILTVYPQIKETGLKHDKSSILLNESVLEKEKVYSTNYCHAAPICKKVCNACMSPNDPDIKGILSAVVDILQSGNETISTALKMNIKAFHEAAQDKKMLRSIRSPNGRDTKAKEK